MMKSFDDLVQNLRLSYKLVYWLTSTSKEKYKTFSIDKKDGTKREINAPVLSVKLIQKWILTNILYKIKVSPYSYGFKAGEKGSPLVKCAEKHKNNLYILKIDLKNFYPSIKREKVYYTFLDLGYNSSISNLLTNACIHNEKLPQGAVTSPYLANLICRNMDYRISGYCNKRDIIYTRYADDLTFSCDNRDALHKIVHTINRIIKDEGFMMNEKKTLFMTPKCKKNILGVTVNDNLLKAPKEMKRMVRSMIHYQVATGDYTDIEKIRGYISYIDSIENNFKAKMISYTEKLAESQLSLFQNLVAAYNENKLYSDMPDMVVKAATAFVDFKDQHAFESMVYTEHQAYLASHGLIVDEDTPSYMEALPF